LKVLLEDKSEELALLNFKLQNELKASKEYQRELEIALKTGEEINHLKSKVFSNLSHEIRTPVTNIIGISKIFLQEKQLDPNHKELIMLVLKSAQRLLAIIDRVLRASKLERANPSKIIEHVDLVQLTSSLVKILKPDADEKHINVLLLLQSKELYTYTDPHLYGQIFNNLLSNAIKFTQEKGKIEINLKTIRENDTDYIHLSIEDNGIGIDESEMDKIFEPYYTVNAATFQADRSTGLGLYILKNNLASLGGQIDVESIKHKGSIFKILIPLKDE
jgi:signal transduction histidine kinase